MNLRKLRMQNKKTQKEVASYLHISQNGYSQYETGKTEPSIEILEKLADYYRTTIDNLVGHDVPYQINKSMLSGKQIELFEDMQKLSEKDLTAVSELVKRLIIKK